MWGSWFWLCIRPSARLPPSRRLTHNLHTHNLLTHNLLTHHLLTHNLLTHIQLTHTPLAPTQLTHTTLAHTHNLHTQTHNLLTHNLLTHNLHTHRQLIHIQLTHIQLTHTQFAHTQVTHTQLTHTQLTHIHLHFVWQAWRLMTWIITLRGRRGTSWHPLSLCVAGVAFDDMDCYFACQAWHLRLWVGSGVALGSQAALWRRGVLRGRRGTLWHPPSLCVEGVALDDMDCYFACQAWHLRLWVGSGVALGSQAALWRRGVLRGRCGTLWHPPSLCAAGVALDDMDWYFACQAWHLRALVLRLVPRRRCDAAAFCVAGVTLCDIHLHFVWQAWRLMTWIVTLHGRRGTLWHPPSLCVAGVAFDDMDCYFACQAWHLRLWVGSGVALSSQAALWRRGVLRGRRGVLWHPPSLCVAGVAFDDMDCYFAWQAWHFVTSTFTLCGRRGIWWHGLLLCVAGVALTALGWLWCCAWFPGGAVTPRRFAWQAWHFVTSTFTLCGRRGTLLEEVDMWGCPVL